MIRAGAASLALALVLAPPPAAAEGPDARIEAARAELTRAGRALDQAPDGPTRLAALGRTAAAAEGALAAYRMMLRGLAAEEARLAARMAAEAEGTARLASALDSLARAPHSALLAYPGGPLEAIRAAALMAAIAPGLDARRLDLALRLDRLAELRAQQETARADVETLLAQLQGLRATAARAVLEHDGTAPSGRALDAPARDAIARARDLAALAAALRAGGAAPAASGDFATPPATPLPLPVAGRIAAGFGAPDPWGRPGRGITLKAPVWAEVRAPVDATLRYAGPLTDYGQVAILEPQPGWLIVLAGLGRVGVAPGQTVAAGAPLGDLGGLLPSSEEFLLEAAGKDGEITGGTLYIEVRHDGTAVDPAPWFGIGDKRGP
ncbi:MAG: peptidoglycan DD-metalloendopeptidase family protein [Thermohalobaculum sp.]|nr:peptidoglycan DD-metalloendopeptidase family protein [Thermohalobaculum sp.]